MGWVINGTFKPQGFVVNPCQRNLLKKQSTQIVPRTRMQKGGKSEECFLKGKNEERKGQQKEAAPKEKIQSTVFKEKSNKFEHNWRKWKTEHGQTKGCCSPGSVKTTQSQYTPKSQHCDTQMKKHPYEQLCDLQKKQKWQIMYTDKT